jgi:hypothetical protein
VSYLPPGAQPPRRFPIGAVVGGVVMGVVGTVLVPVVLGGLASVAGPVAVVFGLLGIVALLLPLILGIVLAASAGPPGRRGFGLGLVIGWGLLLVLAGGLCIALIAGVGSA